MSAVRSTIEIFHFKKFESYCTLPKILLILKSIKMKVKDVMTARSLKYCGLETKIKDVAKIMKDGNCGALPIVDKNQKVLGIITDRDICLLLAKKQLVPLEQMTIGQLKKSKVYTVSVSDDISTVFRLMRTHQIGRLPVVDDKGLLKGIVSLHNIINKSINNGLKELSDISYSGENLLKTIHAVTDRYNEVNKIKGKKTTTKKAKERILENA